jgi:phospholipase C
MPQGLFNNNLHWYNQDTIFDRLNEKSVSWRIYYGDIPQSLLLVHQWWPTNAFRYNRLSNFFVDASRAEKDFPEFTFIEPRYFFPDQNDDHPPHNTIHAQRLIADVYNALRSNKSLWESTLLIVNYDEHGGFYDHVSPPPAVPPDAFREEYTFDRFGIRVPCVLVSPWLKQGIVGAQFDHTSVLKYMIDKWDLAPLGARTAAATSVGECFANSRKARQDTPPKLSVPLLPMDVARLVESPPMGVEDRSDLLNENQRGLIAFAQTLETQLQDDPRKQMYRMKAMLQDTTSQVEIAKQQLDLFLRQQRALQTI